MSTLISELKKEVLNETIPVSALLRKALIVARELKDNANEEWISSELKGYPDREKIPEYRSLAGRPIVRDHYTGWQYLYTQNLTPEMAEKISSFSFTSSIAEFESNAKQEIVAITYNPKAERMLVKALGGEPSIPAIQFTDDQFRRVLDIVRNRILEWVSSLPEEETSLNEKTDSPAMVQIEEVATLEAIDQVDFEKVSLKWLFDHVSWKIWVGLGSFIIIVFGIGVSAGQLSFVQEFIGDTSSSPQISSEELKSKVDQLTQAHNHNVAKLYEGIIAEEKSAASSSFGSYQHLNAAENLRKELKAEDERFKSELKALKELEQTSSNK